MVLLLNFNFLLRVIQHNCYFSHFITQKQHGRKKNVLFNRPDYLTNETQTTKFSIHRRIFDVHYLHGSHTETHTVIIISKQFSLPTKSNHLHDHNQSFELFSLPHAITQNSHRIRNYIHPKENFTIFIMFYIEN